MLGEPVQVVTKKQVEGLTKIMKLHDDINIDLSALTKTSLEVSAFI